MAYIKTVGKGCTRHYKICYDINSDDGKRKRKSKTFPAGIPKSIVMEFKRKVEEEYALGELNYLKDITMDELIEIYLENYSQFVSPTTLGGYKSILNNKKDGKGIALYFGNFLLKNIKPKTIQEYVTFLMSCNISPKTIRSYINLVNVLMTKAEILGYIRQNTNPCRNVVLPPKEHKQIEAYTAEQIKYLLDFATRTENETAKLIITLGALCGLRRGEMAGLTWNDIRLEGNSEIRIERAMVEVDGKIFLKPPKTNSGIRNIPIGANVAKILIEAKANYEYRKAKYDDFEDSGYVLNHEKTGINLMPEAINSRYLRFMRSQDKVPYKNLHMLRHTFASLLASSGASPKDLQSLLGHADSYTSLQIYTHSYKDVQRKDTENLDRTIFITTGNAENVG